ncbi:hypothetical protein [Kitasatospora sp. NPDC018614]|uniref:hypothetical protein n=1 Tax=Kitasatospora sp. NPDC018614 TaxID=3364026 RepID=UPI00379CCE76
MSTDPVAKFAMLHAVAAAALSGADGSALTRMSAKAAREWDRGDSSLRKTTLLTLSACLWWSGSALTAAPGDALQQPRMSELMAGVDKLGPLAPEANRVLGALAGADDFASMARLASSLVGSEGMDVTQLVAGMFEAAVVMVRQVGAVHGDGSVGSLCIDLGQMTMAVCDLLGRAS